MRYTVVKKKVNNFNFIYLEKAIVFAGMINLLDNLGYVLKTQVDNRDILTVRDLGEPRSL